MPMGVMGIGEMPVTVTQGRVAVRVAVRLALGISRRMRMLMMGIMMVAMGVDQHPVLVLMGMALGQMQPQPNQH